MARPKQHLIDECDSEVITYIEELESELRSHKEALEGLRAERDALSAENAALDQERSRARLEAVKLAAHVEAGREAVEHARQWVPQHVWTRLWLWKEEAPTTSLARLKAEEDS